jgi:capsular exopolysaccharide synthesis family protein
MNAADLYRIVKKRFPWMAGTFVMCVAIYSAFIISEKQHYRARARIVIEIPQMPIPITVAQKMLAIMPYDIATWQSVLTSKSVIDSAHKLAVAQYPEITREEMDSIKLTMQDKSTLWVEATAEKPEHSVAMANALAKAANIYGLDKANADIKKTDKLLNESLASINLQIKTTSDRTEHEMNMARLNLGITDIIIEHDMLPKEISGLESKIRGLESSIRNNELRIREMTSSRLVGKLFNLPISLAVEEVLQKKSPAMIKIEEQITDLKVKLVKLLKTKKENHPDVTELKNEIRSLEIEYMEARRKAFGEEIDKEHLGLLVQNSLNRLEINAIRAELDTLHKRHLEVVSIYRDYSRLLADLKELRDRSTELKKTLDQVKTGVRESYITILDEAAPQTVTASEKRATKTLPMFIVFALIISLAAVYVAEVLDTTIRTDKDVRRHLAYHIFAAIPETKKEDVIIARQPRSMLTEVFDTALTLIDSAKMEKNIILITSATPKEGKTSIAVNLATAAARRGKATVIVDGDCRVPSLHSTLALENKTGFSEVLLGAAELESTIRTSSEENLFAITAGNKKDNPYILFEPHRVKPIVDELAKKFQYVILDSSPIMHSSDPLKLSSVANGAILVIESGKIDQRQATWIKQMFKSTNVNVLGVILNKMRFPLEQYYYYYYSK